MSEPDYQWASRFMGIMSGSKNYMNDFKNQGYSRIIFSHGTLDPWFHSGVDIQGNPDLPVLIIKGGAHHLDLRLPQKGDELTNVAQIRQQEIELIKKWIY